MKNSFLIIFSIFCVIADLFSQIDTVNVPVVRYDFKTSSFDKPFPFDESFLIRLVNVPVEYKELDANIREIKKLRKIVRGIEKAGDTITNQAIFDKLPKNYMHQLKMEQFHGDTAFLQLGHLQPNTDYIFEITPPGKRGLTSLEKTALSTCLMNTKIVDNLLQQLIDEAASRKLTTLDFLSADLAKLNQDFKTATKVCNSNYDFLHIENEELQRKFDTKTIALMADFTTQFKNIESKIDDFYRKVTSKLPDKNGNSFANDAKRIDWVTIETKESSKNYSTFIEQLKSLGKQAGLDSLLDDERLIEQFDAFIDNYLAPLRLVAQSFVLNTVTDHVTMATTIGATYFRGSTANARTYLSMDLGIGINTKLCDWFTYSGINIYFRPVNTGIPLNKYGFIYSLPARVSMLAGVTLNSVETDERMRRKGIVGNKAAVAGLGFRVLPWFKINYARMMYYELPKNPLVSKEYLTSDGFVSVSIDANLSALFNSLIKK